MEELHCELSHSVDYLKRAHSEGVGVPLKGCSCLLGGPWGPIRARVRSLSIILTFQHPTPLSESDVSQGRRNRSCA